VRAANTGISAFIDPLGRVFSVLSSDGESVNVEGYLTDQVPMWPVRTFYTTYGDIFVLFCGVMFALLLLIEKAFPAGGESPREVSSG
jgi:apolipoprotein N-acyltransferase